MADNISAVNSIVGRFRTHPCARKSEGELYFRSAAWPPATENFHSCVVRALRRLQAGPMRGSVEFAKAPFLSAPRKTPPESRKNDRRPVLPYSFGVAARPNVSALLASSSGRLPPAGTMLYRIV